MIRFNDGRLRIEERWDGIYVVGEGWLIPVTCIEEGKDVIAKLRNKK
jgi:hypothetical protein